MPPEYSPAAFSPAESTLAPEACEKSWAVRIVPFPWRTERKALALSPGTSAQDSPAVSTMASMAWRALVPFKANWAGMRAYLSHYLKFVQRPGPQDAARIWNGGPTGYRETATIAYWRRVSPLYAQECTRRASDTLIANYAKAKTFAKG